MLLESTYSEWSLLTANRKFAVITKPYSEIVKLMSPNRYDATSGKGEQRHVHEGHKRKLLKALKEGTFTPTPVAASLDEDYQKKVELDEESLTFKLSIKKDKLISQTDGGHRFAAIASLREIYADQMDDENTEKAELAQMIVGQIDALPIVVVVYLDGSPQEDFINLQSGRTVDKTHILSMRIQRNMSDGNFKFAFELALLLNETEGSPFFEKIRMDSRINLPLPFSTLCSRSSSDLSTSLVGLSKVCAMRDWKPAMAAKLFVQLYKKLKSDCAEALEVGKVLTPMGQGGSKGAATMMVGLVILLAYRLIQEDKKAATKEDLQFVADAVNSELDVEVAGNFNSARKRDLLQSFGSVYFADFDVPKHEGLPVKLFTAIAPSAYGLDAPETAEEVADDADKDLQYDPEAIEPDAEPEDAD